MSVAESLYGIREIIKKGWCQGVSALDSDGNEVHPYSGFAVEWCLSGAIECYLHSPSEALDVTYALRSAGEIVLEDISLWNDDERRTKEEVIALIDKAIEIEEKKNCER